MVLVASVESAYVDLVTSVFSTPIAFKAWFATVAVAFAIVQVLTGARIFGKLTGIVPVPPPRVNRIHRWSGRLAILFTLPVAFHCIFILGFKTDDARVLAHSLLGTFVYGVIAVKVFFVRDRDHPQLDAAPCGRDPLHRAGAALEHLQPLVLHGGAIWVLRAARRRRRTGVTRSATPTASADATALIQNAVVKADSAGTGVSPTVLAVRIAAPA